MILVTTPSGDIGARVLDRLLDAGERVRVVARDPSGLARAVRGRVEVVEGSHGDADVIARALRGVDRVFWLAPGDPRTTDAHAAYPAFSRPFATALASSDVTHVVGVSALGRGWPEPAGLVSASLAMDDMIGATGTAYRALACASLIDNLARQAGAIRDGGAFYQPTPGDLRLPHVAKRDVAVTAARLLAAPDWHGVEEVPLHGPADLTFEEMAAILSGVLGRRVAFHEMPMAQFGAFMRSTGASEGMAAAYVEMMTAKNAGMDTTDRPERRDLTPTTFREWCEAELKPMIEG